MVSVILTMYAIRLDIFTCFQSYAIRAQPKQKNVSGVENGNPSHLSISMPIHPHLVVIMRHALARYWVFVFAVRGTRAGERNV